MLRSIRLRRAVAIGALAVAAASCTKKLDTDGLETKLQTALEQQLNTTGVTVSCPTDVTVTQGATFTCSATDSTGAKSTIKVTQVDDEGNVKWEVTDVTQ
jgi:hypothetical protein